MTIVRSRLTPKELDLDPIAGAEAFSLTTRLSQESWSATGRPWPDHERRSMTMVLVPWRRE